MSLIEVTGPITHDEADEIAGRFEASHFHKTDREHARASIPANPKRDDDIRLRAYIEQCRAREAELVEANERLERCQILVKATLEKGGRAITDSQMMIDALRRRAIIDCTGTEPVVLPAGERTQREQAIDCVNFLLNDVAASVEINGDDDDAREVDEQGSVDICGSWTNWEPRRFFGRTWMEALAAARRAHP